jgi:alkyl hydroperoxide reductase subunit AhpC
VLATELIAFRKQKTKGKGKNTVVIATAVDRVPVFLLTSKSGITKGQTQRRKQQQQQQQ